MESTTAVKKISLDEVYVVVDVSEIEVPDLPRTIMDMELSVETRMQALSRYYHIAGEEALEIFNRLSSMYQFTGLKSIEDFISGTCRCEYISSVLRMYACNTLFEFEDTYYSDDEDDVKQHARNRTSERHANAFDILDDLCSKCTDLPTPCRVKALYLLMRSDMHQEKSLEYLQNFTDDPAIEILFRYKSVLNIEKEPVEDHLLFTSQGMKYILTSDSNDVYYRILAAQYLLVECSSCIDSEERTNILEQLLCFAKDVDIDYDRRADSADILLGCEEDYFSKAGAEIIEHLGSTVDGKKITVKSLFHNAQNVHTDAITESANQTLEYLSAIPLKKIGCSDDGVCMSRNIDFDYVSYQILQLLRTKANQSFINTDPGHEFKECKYCGTRFTSNDTDEEFASEACRASFSRDSNVKFALNRINLDRALYSKYNSTLVDILMKVYTYISGHEFEDELLDRLIQELNEMAYTCSSGFATRILNSLSGFGEFNISISFGDQISGNLIGRMNARARTVIDSPLFNQGKRFRDICSLYINHDPGLKERFCSSLQDVDVGPTKELVIDLFLTGYEPHNQDNSEHDTDLVTYLALERIRRFGQSPEETITILRSFDETMSAEECTLSGVCNCTDDNGYSGPDRKVAVLSWFQENILNDLADVDKSPDSRTCFQYFLSVCIQDIREEMWEEFKDLIDDPSFDLWFRKAVATYEDVDFH